MSDHKFNATLKAANGYDAPWLTVSADTPADLVLSLSSIAGTDGIADPAAMVVAAAKKLQAHWTAADKLGATPIAVEPQAFTPQQAANVQQHQQTAAAPAPQQYVPQQQAAPQVQQTAPGPGPSCQHGAMTYREGVGKNSGKPYKGWFCAGPRGSQCETQWVR